MGPQIEDPGHHDAVQSLTDRGHPLDGQPEVAQLLGDPGRVTGYRGELLQPGLKDPHRIPTPLVGRTVPSPTIRTGRGTGGRCGTVPSDRLCHGA